MRAGLTTRCLTFRDTFVCTPTQAGQLTLAFKHGVATLDGGSTDPAGISAELHLRQKARPPVDKSEFDWT